jgi:hypothetical protein
LLLNKGHTASNNVAHSKFGSFYKKSLQRAVRYLHQSDWDVEFFNNEIVYGEGYDGTGVTIATDQLAPFLEDFNYIPEDNIISYELNEKGLGLVDFEFERKGKTSVATKLKLTNQALNADIEGEEYELYVTSLRPKSISRKLDHKRSNKFEISMESTDPRNDQVQLFSGSLDMELGIITFNALTKQAGLTSSKDILLVNSDLF